MKQHQQRPLVVGDFCTTKSRYPENRGLRVMVVEVVPGRTARGRPVPYSIRRVDGGKIPFTTDPSGTERRFKCKQATIARSRLVRIDLDGTDSRDTLIGEPIREEAKLYAWAEEEGIELQGSATLRYMRALGIPITRAKFLELNWERS